MQSLRCGRYWYFLPFLAFGGALVAVGLLFLLLPAQASQAAAPAEIQPVAFQSQAADVIKIGVAADLSQAIPDFGWVQVNSVQLAVNQVNAAGGISIGGVPHTIELYVADSECNGGAGTTSAQALVDVGVVAVIGHTCSSASMTAQSVYAALNIPMISPSSTNPQLTENGFTNTFRVITRDDTPMIRLATFLYKHLELESVAVIDMPSAGVNLTTIFSTTFSTLGGTVAGYFPLASTDDFAATVQAIDLLGVDVIYFSSTDPSEAGQFSLAVDTGGLVDIPVAWFANNHELDNLATYLAAAGTAAEGDLAMLHPRDKDQMPGYSAFNDAYVAAGFPNYGDEGSEWGAYAYDAAQYLFMAIAEADSIAPDDIRVQLHASGAMQGVVDTYAGFDDKGDIIPQLTWFGGVRDGAWMQLTPVGLATDGPVVLDGGFNEMTYEGILRAVDENLAMVYVYPSDESSQYPANLEGCALDGNELCLAVGFMMGDAVKDAALAYPGVFFAIMDAEIDTPPSNLRFYDFPEDEAGYLAGTLAGLMTQSDVVSAVGGLPVPAVVDFLESYGHAAVCINPSATAIISYTTSFIDPDQGAQVAEDQIALGSDVVFAAGGPTGNGALLYATQNGVWGIGVDTDQYITLFDSGTVDGAENLLSSAMKRLDNAAYDAILDVMGDSFTSGALLFGLAQDGVGLAPFHETDASVPFLARFWLDWIKFKLSSGELTTDGPCLSQIIFLPASFK